MAFSPGSLLVEFHRLRNGNDLDASRFEDLEEILQDRGSFLPPFSAMQIGEAEFFDFLLNDQRHHLVVTRLLLVFGHSASQNVASVAVETRISCVSLGSNVNVGCQAVRKQRFRSLESHGTLMTPPPALLAGLEAIGPRVIETRRTAAVGDSVDEGLLIAAPQTD